MGERSERRHKFGETEVCETEEGKIILYKSSNSVSIYHCHRGHFMKSLFIGYKNMEWCHSVVRIDSPAYISFFCLIFYRVYY